jgi:transcriptional regulator with XRE-family HTH domain
MAEKTVSDQLRAAIRAIRKTGMTLREIAEACDTDHSQLSRFMSAEREIGDRTFSRLCKYLKLELRSRDENSTPTPTAKG